MKVFGLGGRSEKAGDDDDDIWKMPMEEDLKQKIKGMPSLFKVKWI